MSAEKNVWNKITITDPVFSCEVRENGVGDNGLMQSIYLDII